MPLKDTNCRNAKSQDKPYRIYDEQGLYLEVQPNGAALVSFTFNLGAGALQRSTLRRKANRGEHEGVPAELMKWVWAAGKRLPGLVLRRRAEASAYSSRAHVSAAMRKDDGEKAQKR